MKKFAVFVAVVALFAVAAPVFAATNPFMDVPMNSWAYDAVAQLASKGILSGYPDGLYKGRQPMTRYEAASVIARALAYVDMTKASKQDVDMLKKLVVEFKDELDALGVRVDALDKDMAKFKSRLNGWKMSGRIRFDVDYRSVSNETQEEFDLIQSTKLNVGTNDGRINIDRFFGEDDKAFFRMQLRGRMMDGGTNDYNRDTPIWHHFFATVPLPSDSTLTVGWTGNLEADVRFYFAPDMPGRYGNWGWHDDGRFFMIRFNKGFENGDFMMYLAHPRNGFGPGKGRSAQVLANVNFNWNERLGFGIGGKYAIKDDWNDNTDDWDNILTGWVGLDFTFIEGVTLHGIFYLQNKSGVGVDDVLNLWSDGSNAWRVAIDINQDFLKFTSFWGEYGRLQESFWASEGTLTNMFVVEDGDEYGLQANEGVALQDFNFWKIGASQKWNDQVQTWLFYAQAFGAESKWASDTTMRQYGVGVDYAYNPTTIFSLNYIKWRGADALDGYDYSRIRFTTQVNF